MSVYSKFSTFGKLLNRQLEVEDRTSSWLAKKLEVSRSSVTRWCNGESRPGSREKIKAIAQALDLDDEVTAELMQAAGYKYTHNNEEPSLGMDESSPAEQMAALPANINTTFLPAPKEIPVISGFVGRQKELAHYQTMLDEGGIVVVEGLVGVGKTALAATLTQRHGKDKAVFWHQCYPRHNIATIIWKLAEFLAWHNQPAVYQQLNAPQQATYPKSPSSFIDFLFCELSRGEYLLCFDDFHHIETNATEPNEIDADLTEFKDALVQAATEHEIQLILTSQMHLEFGSQETHPLLGLNEGDFEKLLLENQVLLDSALSAKLYQRTEGNAQLVKMAINVLTNEVSPAEMIEGLVSTNSIQNFLSRHVYKKLQNNENNVMDGLSALLDYPGTPEEVEYILQSAEGVPRTLMALTNRHLLQRQLSGNQSSYQQHAILRTFYYELLDNRKRRELHSRAGQYHAKTAPLLSATHYFHAADYDNAATFASIDVRKNLIRGHWKMLRDLFKELESLAPEAIDPLLQTKIKVAAGKVHTYRQQTDKALACFEEAYAYLSSVDSTPNIETLVGEICRDAAYLLRGSDPKTALAWVERGLNALNGSPDSVARADLAIQKGHAQLRLKTPILAQQSFQEALDQLPEEPHFLKIHALIGLGNASFYRGELEESRHYFEQARPIARTLEDPFNELALNINIANLNQETGNLEEAIEDYTVAIEKAEQLGHENYAMLANFNSGVLYLHQQKFDDAEARLNLAFDYANTGEQEKTQRHTQTLIKACSYLAELELAQGNPDAAAEHLENAVTDVKDQRSRNALPFFMYVQGRLHLAQKELTAAEECANKAHRQAEELDMPKEQGMSLRLLAQVNMANGEDEQAIRNIAQSILLLADHPYELELSKNISSTK